VIDNSTFIEVVGNLISVSQGLIGIFVTERGGGPHRFDHNVIENHLVAGIAIEDRLGKSSMSHNRILRRQVTRTDRQMLFAIDTRGQNNVILGNYIDLRAPFYGGIRIRGSHTRVDTNQIECLVDAGGSDLPLGIRVETLDGGIPIHHVDLVGNILTGRLDAISVRGGVTLDAVGVRIIENLIERDGKSRPRFGITLEDANDARVIGNQVKDAQLGIASLRGRGNEVVENRLTDGVVGVILGLERTLRLSGNAIENMESVGLLSAFNESFTCDHNRVESCGFATAGIGALIFFITNHCTVESCQILSTGRSRDGSSTIATATLGLVVVLAQEGHISGNRIAAAPTLNGLLEHRAAVVFSAPLDSVEVLGNVAVGVGRTHLVEVRIVPQPSGKAGGKITFSNNRCDHFLVPNNDSRFLGTVALQANHLSVMGNQIRADQRNYSSFNFAASILLTAVGNITSSGSWANLPPTLPAPVTSFNFLGAL
jgi:hypothetical protein